MQSSDVTVGKELNSLIYGTPSMQELTTLKQNLLFWPT